MPGVLHSRGYEFSYDPQVERGPLPQSAGALETKLNFIQKIKQICPLGFTEGSIFISWLLLVVQPGRVISIHSYEIFEPGVLYR